MRAILFSTVAASLLIHAAFGCCWHNAHDSVLCPDAAFAIGTEADCDHDHGDAPQDHHSHGPCHNHSHCHGACNYLPAKNTQVEKCQFTAPLDFAWGVTVLSGSQANCFRLSERSCELDAGPPLRLHLLNQILLI